MTRRDLIASALAGTVSSRFGFNLSFQNSDLDVAIIRGRVIDPETKLDAIRSIGIRAGKIVQVSKHELRAKRVIDAKGLVVAPGFIDPIAHGQDLENDSLQVYDGVTTKLQTESGASNVAEWYRNQAGKRICNYGAGAGHGHARMAVLKERDEVVGRAATDAEIRRICEHIETNLKAGGISLGFGLEYRPATSRWEVLQSFKVAAKFNASCHVHMRYGTLEDDTGAIAALQEVMATAMASGAPLHVVHVPSMALKNTPQALELISLAQARKFDITCDFYPYTAFGTSIDSEVFAEGWQQKFGIDYKDLEWAKTHERLTAESFKKYRAEGGFVIAHAIPESAVRAAAASIALVGSDGRISDGVGHPRSAGTFARVLGKYCREERLLSLPEAIAKMTWKTARRFERRSPDFKRKGRLQVGCDADVTVFDANKVIDCATFAEPAKKSEGISFVLIGGRVVLDGGSLKLQMAGKPLRAHS